MSRMAGQAAAAPVPRQPSVGLALALVGVTLFGYVLFNYYRVGDDLYAWSKTLASWDLRQHLGMSKRWAMQYGHLAFLFVLLVLSKYVLVGDGKAGAFSRFVRSVDPYTLPLFIFHFPLLYFFAALIGHNPNDSGDRILLFVSVLAASLLFGKLCYLVKPLFDRMRTAVGARLAVYDALSDPLPDGAGRRAEAAPLTRSHSDCLRLLRLIATLSIFYGHYTFAQFSSSILPGFDHWRRWAVPFFFMVAGYFAMRSLARHSDGILADIWNRYTSLWFVALPMLLIVPVLDHIGFRADPLLYYLHTKFVTPAEGGPADLAGFVWTLFNSLLYLNEIFLYNWLGLGTELGGVRTFSNDSYWFLTYLMPFTAMLAVMVNLKGPRKYLWLPLLALFFGPPILMLAPLFFAGSLAYLIHQRV